MGNAAAGHESGGTCPEMMTVYDVQESALREDIQEFLDRLDKSGILTSDGEEDGVPAETGAPTDER